jgi:CPA2 family monovalent cation:H+ antiporter-2
MPQHTPLIATIVAGLTVAFVLGAIAQRFRISPLVGYLLAGVLVGPFTPGYVADQELASELAEIGVILLMFGVGLHFSLKDLLAVRAIAIPGALGQMAVATLLGMGLGYALGWPPVSGFVFGQALSVASTVVLLRALQERRILQTDRGRIAVGWLIVEDLAMVLALVIIPALAGVLATPAGAPAAASTDVVETWLLPIAGTVVRVAAFIAFMLIVGRRVIPWILHYTAHTGSRELFRLAVFAIALGVAFGASLLFDVSFALGAFFAGMVLAESELSQQAAEETLPLRDAFAVLFFVSVGMLFNPDVVIDDPWPLAATVGIIIVGKSLAAFAIVRMFRHDNSTASTVAVSLAQIGEFSFILAALGVSQGLLPPQGRDLILGGAIISIMFSPVLFTLISGAAKAKARTAVPRPPKPANDLVATGQTEHVILIGYGRVGTAVAHGLELAGHPFVIVEVNEEGRRRAHDAGHELIIGHGADPQVLAAAGIAQAKRLIIATPDGFEAGGILQRARTANPDIEIIARAHSEAQLEHLTRLGADQTIMAEREIAQAILNLLRPARPEPTPANEAAPAAMPAADPGRPIFTDPEWALLSCVQSAKVGPGGTVGKAELVERAEKVSGFNGPRLAEAFRALVEKRCFVELGDGRLRVTPAGFTASTQAPAS